jgi:MFS family permease
MQHTQDASIWRNSTFVKLFTAFSIGNIGDWFDLFAMQIIFVYLWHVTPMTLSLLVIAYFAPILLLSKISGRVADLFNKLHLLISTDILAGLVTAILVFSPAPNIAIALVAFRSLIASLNNPAQQSIIKAVVVEAQVAQAKAWSRAIFQLARVIGPLLGAAVIAYFSPRACLAINALSFFISAIIMFTVPNHLPDMTVRPMAKNHFWQEWLAGWKVTIHKPLLLTAFGILLIALLAMMMAEAQLAILLYGVHPNEPAILGYMMCISGLGTLITLRALTKVKMTHTYGLWFGLGIVLSGLGYFGMGYYQAEFWLIWLLVSALLQGLGLGIAWVTYQHLLLREAAGEATVQVSGASLLLQRFAVIFGPYMGAELIAVYGSALSFMAVGILLAALGLLMLLFAKVLQH